MFNKIKGLKDSNAQLLVSKDGEKADRKLMVAIGVLMLQMAGADNDFAPEEIKSCFRSLERHFNINDSEAMSILEEADSARNDKDTVSELIETLNKNYDEAQRQLIIALIWKVVVADEKIEKYELRIANQVRVRLQLSEEQAEEARKMAFSGSL